MPGVLCHDPAFISHFVDQHHDKWLHSAKTPTGRIDADRYNKAMEVDFERLARTNPEEFNDPDAARRMRQFEMTHGL